MKFSVARRPALPRLLGRPEVWAFGFTNFLLWVLVAPMVQEVAEAASPVLWLLASIAGVITLLQIRRLAAEWPHLTGGTGSYLARLHADRPWLARYASLAYFIFWLAIIPTAAILVSQLVVRQLGVYGVAAPSLAVKLIFMGLLAAVAFGGTRALSLLHLMLLIPGLAVLSVWVVSGLLHTEHTVVRHAAPAVTGLPAWALAAFLSSYAVYGLDTSAAFPAEAFRPDTVRKCLMVVAVLVIPLFAGGSLVLHTFTGGASGGDLYDQYLAAASPMWGTAAPGLVTFFLATAGLLGAATALAICPRILYQQSADGLFSPLWGKVSPRNVLRVPLGVCLLLGTSGFWIPLDQLVALSASAGIAAYALLHAGLWRHRKASFTLWPHAALALVALELAVLAGAALAAGWVTVIIGAAIPCVLVLLDRALHRLPLPAADDDSADDERRWALHAAVPVEIAVVAVLVVGGLLIGWLLGRNATLEAGLNAPLGVLVALFATLTGVAWSAWTTTRAIESLEQARGETQEVLDSAMDAVITVDARGRIHSANPAAGPLFGREPRTLKGSALVGLVDGLKGEPASWGEWEEYPVPRPDGSTRFVSIVARPLLRAFRPRFTVTLHDLTESRSAARELALSEERLALALAVANEIVWDWHLDTGQFLIAAPGSMAFGYHTDEGKARQDWWLALIHDDDREHVVAGLTAHQAGRTDVFEADYRIRHKDGTSRWVFSRGRVVERDGAGLPVRMIGTTMDQTERRRLETQLVHAQKMDALGQLAGGIAHDFNNALQAILGVAEVLQLRPDDTIGARESDLRAIRIAAERAAGLTRQLLTFSRLRPTSPESIDVNAAVLDAMRLIRRLVGAQIQIEQDLAPDAGFIRADPALLEHALINLAVNARDAMPDGGRLTVTTRRLPGSNGGPDSTSVTVADTGTGMEEGMLGRIFEPFFTTKPPGKGTGLGLPMVYGFVHQANGRIEVESALGAGSTFQMSFPVDSFPGAQAPSEVVHDMPRGIEHLMVVEDDDAIRDLCSSSLQDLGYQIQGAASAETAIEMLEGPGSRTQMVLSDITMPGMGGVGLGEWLALHRPGIPIAYMSGYIPDTAQELRSIDRSRLLLKPFRIEALAALVRRLLDGAAVDGRATPQ